MNLLAPRNISSSLFEQLIKGELKNDASYSNFYINLGDDYEKRLAVRIDNCEIESIFLCEEFDYTLEVLISDSTVKGVNITKGNYEGLTFENIIMPKDKLLNISGGKFKNFYISGTIESHAQISKAQFDKCYFGDVDFKKSITINSGKFEWAYFSGIKTKALFILGGEFNEFLLAGGAHSNDCDIFGLYFSGGRFNKAHIYGLSKINKIYVTSGFISSLTLESEGITEIAIQESSDEGKELKISSLYLNQLGKINLSVKDIDIKIINFNDSFINKDAVMRFSGMQIGALNFNNIINYGQIAFNKMVLVTRLGIQYSDLGKTTLINCDLGSSNLSFESSKITDIFLAGTDMPLNTVATTHQEMRSAYSQIKKVYENRGDTISAGNFFAKEINSYYNILSFKKEGWEKFNLTLNKYSTNHGQSWKRGLISLSSFSILTYIIYCLAIGIKLDFHSGINGWHLFIKVSSYFFEYLNPVHKTDFVLNELGKNVGSDAIAFARMWEAISRIIIGYLLYQFVQAFRKYGKK
jgi:uncharacterized protein YjbI with pentapeptide repeats